VTKKRDILFDDAPVRNTALELERTPGTKVVVGHGDDGMRERGSADVTQPLSAFEQIRTKKPFGSEFAAEDLCPVISMIPSEWPFYRHHSNILLQHLQSHAAL